jgi:phosphatidylglycerol:prolipoprotein diacylglycerol transferase
MPLGYYVHYSDRFLWQFTENFGIRYYGLAYVLGFVLGAVLLHVYWRRGRSPLDPQAQSDLLFAVVAGTLAGGRLGYFLFYDFERLLRQPWEFVRIWDGGMASHGGFIGVVLGLWWAARRAGQPVRKVGDLVATLAPPGLLLGRLANFINAELWGKPTGVPWAVVFPESGDRMPRHPSQLYEAALEGLLLLLYTQARLWLTPKVLERPGRLAGEFLVAYAAARVFCEQFREPDPGIPPVLGLNRGAWLSLIVAAGGLVLVVLARPAKARSGPEPS